MTKKYDYLSSLAGSQSKVNATPQSRCFDKVRMLRLARDYMNQQGGGNTKESGHNVSELNQIRHFNHGGGQPEQPNCRAAATADDLAMDCHHAVSAQRALRALGRLPSELISLLWYAFIRGASSHPWTIFPYMRPLCEKTGQ